jgi:parvulin-like peptidyl-prolyl isomerase
LAKKKVEKPQREFTRRQLSRWQQQKRRQRIIFGSAILIIVAVLAVVGVGFYSQWYAPKYKPLHETVIEVNGTKFNMQYCIDAINFQLGDYYYYVEYYFDYVIETIEQNELIKQEAEELGFTVSDAEVKEILESYGYDDIPAVKDAIRAQLLLKKLNDEYFEQQVPQFAGQRHIMAMFLESESQANEVIARLEAGEDFTALAAELSLDATCKEGEGDLGWRPEGVLYLLIGSSVLEENAFNCEVGALSQPIYEEAKTKMVGYWLIEVVERSEVEEQTEEEEAAATEEGGEVEIQAKVKVMLLASEQEANEVRARLEEGEDFATLAEEHSQHSASSQNGGEFELTSADTISSAFNEFVFDPEVELGNLSQPIRDEEVSTTGGYWLIEVVDIDDNRQIDEESRDLLKGDALSKWVDALWDDPDNNIVSYLDNEKRQWAILHIIGG